MTPQEIALAFGSGGGGFAVLFAFAWPLAQRWARKRLDLSEKRAEVEITAMSRENEARLSLIEEQRKTIVRVAEAQERMAAALERSAVEYERIADNIAHVNERLDRIEAHHGISQHATPPPPEPLPAPSRKAMASRGGDEHDAPPRRQR